MTITLNGNTDEVKAWMHKYEHQTGRRICYIGMKSKNDMIAVFEENKNGQPRYRQTVRKRFSLEKL